MEDGQPDLVREPPQHFTQQLFSLSCEDCILPFASIMFDWGSLSVWGGNYNTPRIHEAERWITKCLGGDRFKKKKSLLVSCYMGNIWSPTIKPAKGPLKNTTGRSHHKNPEGFSHVSTPQGAILWSIYTGCKEASIWTHCNQRKARK